MESLLVPGRTIYRWDLDKTYLRTEFDTVRDLLRHTAGLTYGFFGTGPARDALRASAIGWRAAFRS